MHDHESDFRRNTHKSNIIRSAKSSGSDIPKVKLAQGLSERTAFDFEIAWIAALGREPFGPLVNKTDGGEGPSNPPQEVRDRLADAARRFHTGRRNSPETIARMSAAAKGRRPSSQCIDSVTKSNTGRKQSPETIEKRAAKKRGVPHSAAHAAAISAALKGRAPSKATRLACIASAAQRKLEKQPRTCEFCGLKFPAIRASSRFCSRSCAATVTARRREQVRMTRARDDRNDNKGHGRSGA